MFLLSGVFTTYLGRWFFFESIVRLGPAKASTFQISSPFFTAVVAWIFLGEKLGLLALAAMALAVFGLFLVSVKPGAYISPQREGSLAPGLVGGGRIP